MLLQLLHMTGIRVSNLKPEVTGIPWYDASTYGRILEIMEDASLLPNSYPMWLRGATDVMEHAARNGDICVKVRIDPSGFEAWCESQGYRTDAEARLEFAYEVAHADLSDSQN